MIKYLVKEMLKIQLSILLILLSIFFFQKFIKIINGVILGEIPKKLITDLLILGLPQIIELILPLSVFLSILIILIKFHNSNEITAIYSCGFKKNILLIASIYLALIISMFSIINIIWLLPLSSNYHNKIIKNIKYDLNTLNSSSGKFQMFNHDRLIIFIEKFKNKAFSNLFLVKLSKKDNSPSAILIAKNGIIKQDLNNSKIITINYGTFFENIFKKNNLKITNFLNYKTIIGNNRLIINRDTNKISFLNIFTNKKLIFHSKLQWHITSIISIILMAVIAVPLSFLKKTYQSYLIAIIIYVFFFLIQNTLKIKLSKGNIEYLIWIWLTNFSYLILAIILNIWNNVKIN